MLPLSALRITTLSVARDRKAQRSSTTPSAADKSYRALGKTHGSPPHRKELHGAFWTLADQGAISLGFFLLNVQLARDLDSSEYGTFALLLGGYFLVQHFNASLIFYPLILRLAAYKEDRASDLILISVALTAASSFAFSAIVGACLSAFGRPDIAAAAALYLVLWQLQDVLRRTLLAEFRHRAAILGDGITYIGAAGAVAVLASYHSVSLVTALFAMAGACALAIAVQIIQRLPIFAKNQRTAGVAADFLAAGYLAAWQMGICEWRPLNRHHSNIPLGARHAGRPASSCWLPSYFEHR